MIIIGMALTGIASVDPEVSEEASDHYQESSSSSQADLRLKQYMESKLILDDF